MIGFASGADLPMKPGGSRARKGEAEVGRTDEVAGQARADEGPRRLVERQNLRNEEEIR
jgi:hypothetical protein